MKRGHYSDYALGGTDRCERALVTLIGDIGPWRERVVLVGGLAPLYIVGSLPLGAPPHAGTTDVDLVVALAVDDASETYETLYRNLKDSGFDSASPSYRWFRLVDGKRVEVEFLCETDRVEAGRIYRPKEGTGSGFSAFNVRGASLVARDFIEANAVQPRLDDGGISTVTIRVAGLLPYVVLKILAFQDRHGNKDAYDLVYTLMNYPDGGPKGAGRAAAGSMVREDRLVSDALVLLGERFAGPSHDGPSAYSSFLADVDDIDGRARLRNEAVAAVEQFLITAGAR